MPDIKKPKNIVLLTIDCLRTDRLAYSGNLNKITPFLDSIAKKSVVFHNCYTPSSATSSSMCSYLTSKYPFEHGSRFTGDKLNFKDHTSFVELLQEQYHTVGFSSVENLNKYFNYDAGFNEYFDHIKYYSQFRNFGFNRKYNLLNFLRKLGIKNNHYITGSSLNAKIRRWFKFNSSDKLLLWSHFFDLHTWSKLLPKDSEKLYNSDSWADKVVEIYNNHLNKTDYFIEDFFSILSSNIDMDETLIIISADHGEMLGEHDSYMHGITLYDQEMNIPLIFYYPKYLDSIEVHDNISTIDIAPTILDICGLDISDSFSGLSFKNILHGKKEKSRFCYMESSYTDKYALKLNDYKFIYNGTNYIKMPRKIIRGNELYNLKEDKTESINIIDKKIKVAKKLENLLFKILKVEDSLKVPSKLLLDETVDELIKLGYLKKEYNEK